MSDYEMAAEIHADTAERMKALGDPLRLTVLDLVLEGALTVSQLAARLGRPRGTVAHHVDLLVAAGLLQVVRTRKVRAIEERFYGRVARTIVLPGVTGELPFIREAMAEADYDALAASTSGAGFSFRHARIPAERAQEFVDRLHALALEFIETPRGGDTEYALLFGVFPTARQVAPPTTDARAQGADA
jgi:DNA-binding transcriptional ArsR family regulator